MDVLLSSCERVCKLQTLFFWDKSLNMFKFLFSYIFSVMLFIG